MLVLRTNLFFDDLYETPPIDTNFIELLLKNSKELYKTHFMNIIIYNNNFLDKKQ